MAFDLTRGRMVTGNWCCGIGDDIGFDVKLKDRQAIFDKVDDLRYDVRRTGGKVSASVVALAGAVGLVGLALTWGVARRPVGKKGQ